MSLLVKLFSLLCVSVITFGLAACGGDARNDSFLVSTNAVANGAISPTSASVNKDQSTTFTVTPETGFKISSVTGCDGSLLDDTYTTGSVTADCTVTASFVINTYNISTDVGENGNISPSSNTIDYGETTSFTVTPDVGYSIDSITGCNGSLVGKEYTTGIITGNCEVLVSFDINAPITAAIPTLNYALKTFRFSWTDVADATYYKLLENSDGSSGFSQVGSDILQGTQSVDHIVPLYARINASYILQSCNSGGCIDSNAVNISGTLVAAIGYFKASNTDHGDLFGAAVSLSGDGNTLAVGAWAEDGDAKGIDGADNNNASVSGAVYVFSKTGTTWTQQAYVKGHNTEANDFFGNAVSLSADGNTLAVGAYYEAGDATGIDGPDNNNTQYSGAVYVFSRTETTWTQQAYVKASNTDFTDLFGAAVSLSGDGNTLAVGAWAEDGDSTEINGTNTLNATSAGAVYVFKRVDTIWAQQAYVKASNTDAGDFFGISLSLSGDGSTLVVGANSESSDAIGIDGDDNNNNAADAGAAYVFSRSGDTWTQQAYLKAFNTDALDRFGTAVSVSADGNTIAVGAHYEASDASGINGEDNNNAPASGAVYVFSRVSTTWTQQAYVKVSDPNPLLFGTALGLSSDGNTLVVGIRRESSNATGINGTITGNLTSAGGVYMYSRIGITWSQQVHVKASNTGENDNFGAAVSLSANGDTLAVGALGEASDATGIGGEDNNNATSAGAVYLY